MGGSRSIVADRPRERFSFVRASVPMALLLCGALTACNDEPVQPGVVEAADAYTAIISWQAVEQEPVLDKDGEEQLPVIYVVAANGDPIDVGVQAAVAEATSDEAVVRFADDANDSFDADTEGAPVHDEGVMLAIGAIPEPARSVDIEVDRFEAQDDYQQLSVSVRANDDDPDVSTDDGTQRASVMVAIER